MAGKIINSDKSLPEEEKKILLMGNPNVGKSAIFSRLTGARVTISNYPGTTVGFSQGFMKLGKDEMAAVIDVPGIYNLEAVCKAEEVALEMLKKGDIVINIVDSTNLERNLFLALELRERNIPVVVALNMWDETRHKGVEIDARKLEEELGVPVIPTCGLTGEGIKELVERLRGVEKKDFKPLSRKHKWEEIGRIIELTQTLHHHHHTFLERLEDISTRPLTGLPIAVLVVYLSFTVIRFIGEGLIGYVFEPLFEKLWLPLMQKLSLAFGGGGFLHDILIGNLVEGNIDFGQSFGLLTTGLYVPIAAVLPYILSFYLVLGILEDFGYLPRLATQVDNLMHRLGLHGYAIVPMILGLGCNVPGAMALRLLENRREKFIAATLMAIAVPCMAQIAMIVGLVGQRGGRYVALIFGILFSILVIKGLLMNRFMKGRSPEILWEIPPYRIPQLQAVVKKLYMRVSEFLKEAVPYVMLGIFIVNILYILKVLDFLSHVFAPVLSGMWGLPRETISAMLIGFLRKDVAVGMLGSLDLTTKQLVIACTILAVYFPCMATFVVMVREIGAKDMAKAAGLMILTAVIVGMALNILL
ncbi:MAG: ferrous iron transporter B [Candidatus Omnitrophota bacterium]|nr:ferrous iron transporter B [Candidatus Omnitrophota bacterium]